MQYSYGGVPRAKITGDRLIVWINLSTLDLWCIHKKRRVRFFDSREARDFADRKGYDDGIHIKVARGYGLKQRVDALMGSAKTQEGEDGDG